MEENPKISLLAKKLLDPRTTLTRKHESDSEDDLDDDDIFAELEAEIENDSSLAMREQGLEVVKREMERLKEMKKNEHGHYTEITDEKEVIRVSAKEPQCVVHFYHSNFKRCEIMDKHLAILAPKYFNTRFFRVFVENTPWLVEKLGIKVLPCVVCFVDGISKDRLIGFEELGNSDAFETAVLELRLSLIGVIQKPKHNSDHIYKISSRPTQRDDDDVFDLDD